MKNWIYITIFSEKFPNQCKEETNSKMPSNILPSYKASFFFHVYGKNKLGSQIFCLVFKFNVCFIRLEKSDLSE